MQTFAKVWTRAIFLIGVVATALGAQAKRSSDFLYVWTASADTTQPDFLAVFDVRPTSDRYGRLVTTVPVPGRNNGPHHTEHAMPADGRLFANGFGTGKTFIFDMSDPSHPRLDGQFGDVGGMMHPHSFLRLPNGNVLATFQMQHDSLGVAPGGLAELTNRGGLVRHVSANSAGIDRRIRPYSAAIIPKVDRVVTTTTDMVGDAEISSIQLWRLSDLQLLKTFDLPQGPRGDEAWLTAEPRLLADGKTVLVSTFDCGLYLLRGLDGPSPAGQLVASFPRKKGTYCAIPVIAGHYYLVTVPAWNAVVSLDISNPAKPREVSRVVLGEQDVPHWIALEPNHRRVVITGYGDLKHRVMLANFDEATGRLTIDQRFRDAGGTGSGMRMDNKSWPHGGSYPGIPHGAVFSLVPVDPNVYDRVILGGHVMDPASRLDAVRNIGLLDGRIAVITTQAVRGRDTVAARGLIVAPGFIDLHAHGQTPETYRFQSLDGVTTSLELELGTSDVAAWYRERSAGARINYGVSIGHIKVRMSVMHDSGTVMPVSDGAYRAASPAQIGEIAKRIEIGLSEGAVSIGAGFPYTPAATRDELLALFRVAARTKTPVHLHIRPGVDGLSQALALAAETKAALHVVHINSAALAETPMMLQMISDARARGHDVTTEAYPYAAGMTEIQSATIQDTYRAAPDDRLAALEWPSTGERLNRESFERYSKIGGPVVVHTNTEPMVAAAITSPLTIIASDAYWQGVTGHPRTTGTFSKVLGRYARDARSLSLMEAIRKMTLMPAQRLEARVPAMLQKGRLRVGADADITIFDAARVLDRSTYREPSLSPVGIQHVIVNGVSVVANGRAVEGVAPGKAVRASR